MMKIEPTTSIPNLLSDTPRRFEPTVPLTAGSIHVLQQQLDGADLAQQSRMLMVGIDPLLRKLPYEQRTAILLNLLVTYASEEPAAQAKRGKFINAMVEEFRVRLQRYLPLNV